MKKIKGFFISTFLGALVAVPVVGMSVILLEFQHKYAESSGGSVKLDFWSAYLFNEMGESRIIYYIIIAIIASIMFGQEFKK